MQCAWWKFLRYNSTGALQCPEVLCSILHHSSIWCGVLQICSAVVVCKILHHHGTWCGFGFLDMFCEEHVFFVCNFGSWIFFPRSKNSIGLAVVRHPSFAVGVPRGCREHVPCGRSYFSCFAWRTIFLYGTRVCGLNPVPCSRIIICIRGSIPRPDCLLSGP